jgi:hypothetical protein
MSLTPGFSQVQERKLRFGKRLNGFPLPILPITRLKPGVNEKLAFDFLLARSV